MDVGGGAVHVEYVVYGALIISFGLRFWQAALVIVVGNLSYLITGIGSLQGPAAGTPVFAIARAPFGPRGARSVSVFNWMTQVGYETEGLALVVLAGLALAAKAGVHSSTGLKVTLIVAAAAIQLLLPLFGHRAMLRVLTTAGGAVRGAVHCAGDLRTAQGPSRRRRERQLGDDVGRAGAHPFRGRLRVGDERERLLPVSAT